VGRKRNEPSYVRYVAGTVAELKKIPFEQVAIQTNKNAKRLFKITG
jgi:TatD DNase family protein